MSSEEMRPTIVSPTESADWAAIEPIRILLSKAPEHQRYRLLAELLKDMADRSASASDGRDAALTEQVRQLSKKVQEVQRENANLQDQVRTLQADLVRRTKQVEAEELRGQELTTSIEEHRRQRDEMQREIDELQTQLTARSQDLYQVESERDDLRLRMQRAEMKAGDRSTLDAVEDKSRDYMRQITELQERMESQRAEKDSVIKELQAQILSRSGDRAVAGEAMLMKLWDRLAQAKPASMAQGGVQPSFQAAENLVDCFIDLSQFVHKFDQDMRVFLNRYTRHHQAMSRQWQVYAAREDFLQTIQQTVTPQNPKQVGVVRLRLKAFHKFCFAAMVSTDAVIESIASELQAHLLSDVGAGGDANAKIRDYIRNDAHELFMDHMKKLRSEKMAEVFVRG